MDSIDDKIKKNKELKEAQTLKRSEVKKIKKEETLRQKKMNEKKLKERDILISEINKQDSVRTEYPNTYRYQAKDSEGHDTIGYLVAFTKQEVFNFLESEGYTVYKLETNKYIELFKAVAGIEPAKAKMVKH